MKIKNIKYIGKRQTYNIEMAGSQHNYICKQDIGEPIHKNSHGSAYILISYYCLWLKTHYLEEWWAAVMSHCHPDKLSRYMGIARSEGVKFKFMSCDHLTPQFSVEGDKVTPGLLSVKEIGKSVVYDIEKNNRNYSGIEEFVEVNGKNKTVIERMVKLGAFDSKHSNRKAIWAWYLMNYGSGKNVTALKKVFRYLYSWSDKEIEEERKRKEIEYFKEYPRKRKTPTKILNWVPSMPKQKPTKNTPIKLINDLLEGKEFTLSDDIINSEKVCKKIEIGLKEIELALEGKDYNLKEVLKFEKEYLDYHLHSPLDMFETNEGTTISNAKEDGILEAVIESAITKQGKMGKYLQLVVTDGLESTRMAIWSSDIDNNGRNVFRPGKGLRMYVKWSDKFKSFNLRRGSIVVTLTKKDENEIAY